MYKMISVEFARCHGKRVTNASLGIGSFLFVGFDVIKEFNAGSTMLSRPSWQFWINCASWKICRNSLPYIGSDDDSVKRQEVVDLLLDQIVTDISFTGCGNDLNIHFSDGWSIMVFCNIIVDDYPSWSFSMPDGRAFIAKQNILELESDGL